MSLRIRRGTESQRLATVAEAGEILWTTDQRKLWVGTGASNNPGNASMVNVGKGLAGTGLVWNDTDQVLEVGNFSITTTDVSEGNNLYFRADRAQTVTQAMFTSGDATHTGISFLYNDIDQTVNATVSLNLDGLSDVQIVGTPATNSVLKYNGASWTASTDSIGLSAVVGDTAPNLGGNLTLNSHNIIGTGNIDITGKFVSTSNTSYITINENSYRPLSVLSLTTGSGDSIRDISICAARGSVVSPENTQSGDVLASFSIRGYYNGAQKIAGIIQANWNSDATMTNSQPSSTINIGVGNNNGGFAAYSFSGNGTMSAPVIQTGVYSTSPSDLRPAVPAKGMIIFNDTLSRFEGWNGTAWVALG